MDIEEELFESEDLSLDVLRLDPENPRLPENVADQDQDQLIEFVANAYDALTVARSIALHGYFPSEPLIVIANDDVYTVIEGNRRLAALKLLQDAELRDRITLDDEDDWEELSEQGILPDEVPVIVVPTRRSVAPIVGYRHISGIERWDPWAKARFVASLVEVEELPFEEVATEVGESINDIRAQYRNYRIIRKAREELDIPTEGAESSFGVFTRAMSSLPLRQHIGAPAPSEVNMEVDPIPEDRSEEVAELLSWLFGDENSPQVISESRDITTLGRAVGSQDGLGILRDTRDLEEAFIAAGGLRERLLRRLNRAVTNLDASLQELHDYADDDEVIAAVERCGELIRDLVATLEQARGENED